jgi:uncharacterized protein DUF1566
MKNSISGLVIAVLLSFPAIALAAGASGFPTWSSTFTKGRFTVLPAFGGAGVLDKETGLVWEQSPSTLNTFNWFTAVSHCNTSVIGGRAGWRLPSVQELGSILDSTQSNPALPAGNPFTNEQPAAYWAATSDATDPLNKAWVINFSGNGNFATGNSKTATTALVWCVRGGSGVFDAQ